MRGGTADLLLVALILFTVVGRTPAGLIAQWGWSWATGADSHLPSLTSTFSHGMAAPPVADVTLLPQATPLTDDQLPEPYRSAFATVLVDGLPPRLQDALRAEGLPETAEGALTLADRWYEGTSEQTLEELTLGPELRARAIQRARASGEVTPERYTHHRRYLPGAVQRDADRVVGGTLALATVLDLAWPLQEPYRISSPFGYRTHPTLGTRTFHNGVDLAVPIGTEVRSAQSGKVVVAGENSTSGRYLIVDHGHGVKTSYCHLDEVLLQRGEEVTQGQPIARSGNSGRSTGPHLHFIVKIAGNAVDPMGFKRP